MGSLTTVAATIGELLDFFRHDPSQALVVASNQEYYPNFTGDWYGLEAPATYRAQNVTVSRRGTEAVVTTPTEPSLKVFLPLYGAHQLSNALPSLWLANKLGLPASQIVNQFPGLPYISRRHEPHFGANNILVLDNSYNTNPDSARASLTLLNQLDATQRVVVTLGFVELGETSHQEHYAFGQLLAKQADIVALAQGDDTDAIKAGFLEAGGQPDQILIGKDLDQAYALVSGTIKPGAVILFEGGYREILV
jgi:UDP-N-acetylmuramoyl-tripeptide--D-alanyl-D-alanine ligase